MTASDQACLATLSGRPGLRASPCRAGGCAWCALHRQVDLEEFELWITRGKISDPDEPPSPSPHSQRRSATHAPPLGSPTGRPADGAHKAALSPARSSAAGSPAQRSPTRPFQQSGHGLGASTSLPALSQGNQSRLSFAREPNARGGGASCSSSSHASPARQHGKVEQRANPQHRSRPMPPREARPSEPLQHRQPKDTEERSAEGILSGNGLAARWLLCDASYDAVLAVRRQKQLRRVYGRSRTGACLTLHAASATALPPYSRPNSQQRLLHLPAGASQTWPPRAGGAYERDFDWDDVRELQEGLVHSGLRPAPPAPLPSPLPSNACPSPNPARGKGALAAARSRQSPPREHTVRELS